jgi:hypothetical protein
LCCEVIFLLRFQLATVHFEEDGLSVVGMGFRLASNDGIGFRL